MPTIKRKVEMNLVGLLEWAWENEIKNKDFESSNTDCACIVEVSFDDEGDFDSDYYVSKDDYFTVEIKEEITEDTKINNLCHLTIFGFTSVTRTRSINDAKDDHSVAFYIMNDDHTMTLIWTKEKGLVD